MVILYVLRGGLYFLMKKVKAIKRRNINKRSNKVTGVLRVMIH